MVLPHERTQRRPRDDRERRLSVELSNIQSSGPTSNLGLRRPTFAALKLSKMLYCSGIRFAVGLEKNVRKKGFKRATKSLMIKKLTTMALEVANEDEG